MDFLDDIYQKDFIEYLGSIKITKNKFLKLSREQHDKLCIYYKVNLDRKRQIEEENRLVAIEKEEAKKIREEGYKEKEKYSKMSEEVSRKEKEVDKKIKLLEKIMEAKSNDITTIVGDDGKPVDIKIAFNNLSEESKQEESKIDDEKFKKKEQDLIIDAKIIIETPFNIQRKWKWKRKLFLYSFEVGN